MTTFETTAPLKGAEPMPSSRNARAWTTLGQLLTFARKYPWLFLLCVVCHLFYNGGAIAVAVFGAHVVSTAILGESPAQLMQLIVILAGLVVASGIGYWGVMWWCHVLAYRILVDLRVAFYNALERLSPSYMTERRSGDLVGAALADMEQLEWFYAHTMTDFVAAVVLTIAVLIALALIQPLLALILLPFIALVCSVPRWLWQISERQGKRLKAQLGELNAEMVDAVQGMREIVSFGRGPDWLRRITGHSRALAGMHIRYGARGGLETMATSTLTGLGMLAVLCLAAWFVTQNVISWPMLPVALILGANAFRPVLAITEILKGYGLIAASAARIFGVITRPALVEDQPAAQAVTRYARPSWPVQFNAVRFRYAPEMPLVLNDVSFEVKPNETVALVGHSGAGKSTCTHLLMRFWDVQAGSVSVGGYDVRDLTQESLRDLITIVPQDIYLFNTSLRDNIRLGKPDATDAEVEQAAKDALIHDFIMSLPQGYETVAGERGVQMSGGQRQRIAIARALLKDAPILIMDEAVSNLDTENERALQTAMARARAGRTTLIIAHRLSTIKSADRIVVLEHGRAVETGTHDALVAQGGAYAQLIASQREGALVE